MKWQIEGYKNFYFIPFFCKFEMMKGVIGILSVLPLMTLSRAYAVEYKKGVELQEEQKKSEILVKPFQLNNSMKVLVISYSGLKNISVGISVDVGTYNDPEEFPGLALLVEKLIINGSYMNPNEEGINSFIHKHNGSLYSYTSPTTTAFHLILPKNDFLPGFNRFSQLFKRSHINDQTLSSSASPALLQMHLQSMKQQLNSLSLYDDWRIEQVYNQILRNQNKLVRSPVIDVNSLDALKINTPKIGDFFNTHYQPNKMRIVIMGPQAPEVLKGYLNDSMGDLSNASHLSQSSDREYNLNSPVDDSAAQGKGLSGAHSLDIKVVRSEGGWGESSGMEFDFFIRWPQEWKNEFQEFKYLIYLLNHEQEGSLIAELRRQGYAFSLSATYENQVSGVNRLRIKLDLTDKGRDHLQSVKEITLNYFEFLKSANEKDSSYKNFQVAREILLKYFELPSDMETLRQLNQRLWNLNLDSQFLRNALIGNDVDFDRFKGLLSRLIDKNLFTIELASRSTVSKNYQHTDVSNIPFVVSEKITQDSTKPAGIESFPVDNNFILPPVNSYLPQSFDLLSSDSSQELKVQVVGDPEKRGVIDFVSSNPYQVPVVYSDISLVSKNIPIDAQSSATALVADVALNEYLGNLISKVTAANQKFNVNINPNYLKITLVSYSESTQKIFIDLLREIKGFKDKLNQMSEEELKLYQAKALAQWKNPVENLAGSSVDTILNKMKNIVMIPDYPNAHIVEQEIDHVTRENLKYQWERLISSFGVKGLVVGNYNKENVERLYDGLLKTLNPQEDETVTLSEVEVQLNRWSKGQLNTFKVSQCRNEDSLTQVSTELNAFSLGEKSPKNIAMAYIYNQLLPRNIELKSGKQSLLENFNYSLIFGTSFDLQYDFISFFTWSISSPIFPNSNELNQKMFIAFNLGLLNQEIQNTNWVKMRSDLKDKLLYSGESSKDYFHYVSQEWDKYNRDLSFSRKIGAEIFNITPREFYDFISNFLQGIHFESENKKEKTNKETYL